MPEGYCQEERTLWQMGRRGWEWNGLHAASICHALVWFFTYSANFWHFMLIKLRVGWTHWNSNTSRERLCSHWTVSHVQRNKSMCHVNMMSTVYVNHILLRSPVILPAHQHCAQWCHFCYTVLQHCPAPVVFSILYMGLQPLISGMCCASQRHYAIMHGSVCVP